MAVAAQTIGASRARGSDARVQLSSKRSTSLWIIAGTLATLLSVAAAAGLQMRKDHASALQQVEREATAFVGVSGTLVGGALDRTQAMLIGAIKASAAGAPIVVSDPALFNVIATDGEGNVVWDRNGIPTEPKRITDTALLQRLATTQSTTPYIVGPFADQEFGKSPITIAMRNEALQGQLLFAVIDPAFLTKMLESVQGSRGVNLIIADAQSRKIAGTPIEDVLYSGATSALPAQITTTPSQRYLSDGSAAYLATARLIPGYDLRLIAIARAADALGSWYNSLPLYSIMIFGPSLLGAALAWALLNQMERTSRSDSALRRTEERFELAVSGAKCGIWDWDLANRRLYWSGAMNALLGRGKQPRMLSIEETTALIHPEDRHLLAGIESSIREGSNTYDQSFRAQHVDGHYVWLRAKGQHYRTIRSEGGRLSGIVLDISDQKNAAERLDTAERHLEAAFENAAEAFVLWDRDDRLILCNRRFVEFYGLGRAQVGEPRSAIMARATTPGQSADGDAEPLELFDSSGTSSTIELQRAGNRWLLVSERRALDGGKITVATDITSLKAHEDELKASRNLLQARTMELATEKERAEEASRTKSEFLANVSHELRTPLNAIIGFSDVMRNEMLGALPPRYVEYAADIHRSGQHLLDLINDVLNMARIEAGKLELDLQPVAPSLLLEDVIKTIEPRAKEANLQIRLHAPELPPVLADKRAIKQVLLNLMSNAIKFNSADGFITVEARREAEGNGVAIWIHDTGIGIADQDLSRVIKPFERVQSAMSGRRGGGMGLGLAVSTALIELHGGKLNIESELGIGTSVNFTLPYANT